MALSRSILVLAALAPLASTSPAFAQNDAAGHAIAEKFSGEAEAKAKARSESMRKAEELRREIAKRVAVEARRKAEQEREAAERARAEAEEQDMLARARREAEEREEAARLARETEQRLVRERAEAELRAAAEKEQAKAEEARRAAEAAEFKRREDERRAEAARLERESAEQRAAEERRQMELKREEEARQLAEKHNRLRLEREAKSQSADRARNDWALDSVSPDREPEERPPAQAQTHATVLLVLEPGNRGIRRYDRSADPVLCAGLVCYLSAGAAKTALKLPRPVALGPGNTLGRRAGACRHSLTCIYRNVELGIAGASLQPVDLRILRHDRRETRTVSADMSCGIDSGRLTCANTLRTPSWRAWIVPESIAERAGDKLLREALSAGLPDQHAAFRGEAFD